MADLQLINLCKSYVLETPVVRDLSLKAAGGSLTVLAGPSGCGKSTTLRMIAGLEKPTSGQIELGGRRIDALPPHKRDVAMVFQNHALYPHMTVGGNLGMPLKARGENSEIIQKKINEVARALSIDGLLGRKPAELSGGERQRVALGRALIRQPGLFLLDEPLSSLDAPLRGVLRRDIRKLQKQLGSPTIYVTHDQEEAMSLADNLVIMNRGEIVQQGPPQRIYDQPANRFVARFLGGGRMNFIEGLLELKGDQMVFKEGRIESGRLTLLANGFTLCIPSSRGLALKPWIGKPTALGVRPEHLSFLPVAGESALELHVEVRWIESVCGFKDVVAATPCHELVARVDSRQDVPAGSSAALFTDWRDVSFFEPGETGMNLSLHNEFYHALA